MKILENKPFSHFPILWDGSELIQWQILG